MIGNVAGWLCGGFILALAGLAFLVVLPHNLRILRLRRIYKELPNSVKEPTLRLIQDAAATHPFVTFLWLDEKQTCDTTNLTLESHVGGAPYAEAGEVWPGCPPAKFLLQVRLEDPSLGQKWLGRLLTVFFLSDAQFAVRSYPTPSLERYVPLSAPPQPPCIPLISIRLPVDDQPEGGEEDIGEPARNPASPARLCDMVPAIPQILSPFTKDPAGLLSEILRPFVYDYNLAEWQIAYEGGDPSFIQPACKATCNDCGKPMRFLLQFGEIIPGVRMADGGVCHVFGCDEHPDRCSGFLDTY
jgi:hypothetical protein